VKKRRVKDYVYYISECEAEDRLFKNVTSDLTSGYEVNYTSSPLVLPTISGYTFFSTIGLEKGPLDSWPTKDLRLYRKLRKMPQHFKLVSGVCLTRENFCVTDLWSVYIKNMSGNCGCEYCKKGLTVILREIGDG